MVLTSDPLPPADVHTFNGLISAAPFVKEKYNDKWDLVVVSVCVCVVEDFTLR